MLAGTIPINDDHVKHLNRGIFNVMPLSTKGRYAARIMVCLASHTGTRPATKHQIGAAENISADYVEQIMIRLKAAHLVKSHRGRNGGFSLARDPDSITLAQVLKAVDGPVCPVPCLVTECERASSCPTRPVWQKAAKAVDELFSTTTIGQMARDAGLCQASTFLSYQI
jgi:Rrf2 family protein